LIEPTPPPPVVLSEVKTPSSNLQGISIVLRTERPHRKISIPQLHPVLMASLKRAEVEDVAYAVSANIAAKLIHPDTLNEGVGVFIEWCHSEVNGVPQMGRPWYELMFWAAYSLDAAELRAQQLWDDGPRSVFTHFELWADGCRVPTHAALNNFVAHRDDDIWSYIWPPNDWLCGCTLVGLLPSEALERDGVNVPGIQRVDEKLMNRCISWDNKSTRSAIKLLS
jgi:hypothetical protein